MHSFILNLTFHTPELGQGGEESGRRKGHARGERENDISHGGRNTTRGLSKQTSRKVTGRMGARKSTEVGKESSHLVHILENRQRTGGEVEEEDRDDE